MKIIKIVLLALVAASVFPQATSAAATQKPIHVYVQGLEVEFDQAPIISNGRVLVPFRQIAEEMEISVTWDQKSKRVTAQYKSAFKKKTVIIPVNGTTATVDNKSVKLDVPAKIVNGRIMVPLRFLTQSLGAQVDWNNDKREVEVTYWKENGSSYYQINGNANVTNSFTEAQFDNKLNAIYDGEEFVLTSKWTNLMDAGRVGIVAQHMGFFRVNGKIREVSMVIDGELNASGTFDGYFYLELYDENTGEFIDDITADITNIAFDKIVKFNVKMAVQLVDWRFG
ncbi:copper amine oxidase N-terminal domain-containing protein [Paenibacillus sp. strain BS8-2]